MNTESNRVSARRQGGFTLVELLIVVIILTIIAAIVIPQLSASTDDAKVAALDSNLARIRSAIDLYYQHTGELSQLLLKDPALRKQSAHLLRIIQAVVGAVAGHDLSGWPA